jgi:hypothetical protein
MKIRARYLGQVFGAGLLSVATWACSGSTFKGGGSATEPEHTDGASGASGTSATGTADGTGATGGTTTTDSVLVHDRGTTGTTTHGSAGSAGATTTGGTSAQGYAR